MFRLSIGVPDWTRYRDVAPNDTVRNGGAFLRMKSALCLRHPLYKNAPCCWHFNDTFPSFFILIVLLMVLLVMIARDYIR